MNKPSFIFTFLIVFTVFVSCVDEDKNIIKNDSGISCLPQLLSSCFIGSSYADCSGVNNPKLYCSSSKCLWISNGCPVIGMDALIDKQCKCLSGNCPSSNIPMLFFMRRGKKFWTVERDLNIKVNLSSNIQRVNLSLHCQGCTNNCIVGDNPCKLKYSLSKDFPGTYILEIGTNGGLYGWRLEIEIDFRTSPIARICRVPFSDSISCSDGKIICATSGKIEINAIPKNLGTDFFGTFNAKFNDGIELNGTF